MIFFTSDQQFGHLGALIAFNRPFRTIAEMDAGMIDSWNSRVAPKDTVYICGDFSTYDLSRTRSILNSLHGDKVLIFGNHDYDLRTAPDLHKLFVCAEPMLELTLDSRKLCLCHYPMFEWPGERSGGFLICGHVHNREHGVSFEGIMNLPGILNCGVDINHFRPVTFEELWQNNSAFYTKRSPLFCEY